MTRIEYIAAELTSRKKSVTCAESCTGGLLAAALTSISGSSAYLETINHYGAVSEEVVREMALGALIKAKSDYALSISGIAGPDGGTAEKPVGTVWFGFATKQRIWAKQYQFSGNREEVRHQAVQYALAILEHYLKTNTP